MIPEHAVTFFTNIQKALSRLVLVSELETEPIDLVCGLDVSYRGEEGVAAAVVWSLRSRAILETSLYTGEVLFPYLPGLLYLREAPLMLTALKRLKSPPELLLVDGHGLAHPRRAGLASLVGLLADTPSIGVAKSLLYGEVVADGGVDYVLVGGERVGLVYRYKAGRRLYLSIGHKTDLKTLRVLLDRLGDDLLQPLMHAHTESRRAAKAG